LIQEGGSDLPEHIDVSVRKKQPMDVSDLCREEDSSVESRLWQNECPEPSCVSMKSDDSMSHPIGFSLGDSSADLSQKHKASESHTAKKNLDSIFKELEQKIICELKSFKRLLSPDYPECSERDRYDDEGHSRVREGLLKITLLILRKMNQTDLANTLQTKLMPVSQQKLKSRLQDKYQRISERMSNHGDSTRLNEIYTELYITEGGSGEVNNEHECVVSDSGAAPGDAPWSALDVCGRARFGCNQAVATEFLNVLSGISAKITTTASDGQASVACYQDVLSDRVGGVSPVLGLDIAGLASVQHCHSALENIVSCNIFKL
ncbi:hypothetical protein QQF64_018325, partial [Cirrhinus molitorella]